VGKVILYKRCTGDASWLPRYSALHTICRISGQLMISKELVARDFLQLNIPYPYRMSFEKQKWVFCGENQVLKKMSVKSELDRS